MNTSPNQLAPAALPWQQPATVAPTPRFLTIEEIATYLNISKWMVYSQINDKKLKTVTIGKRRLVTPEDFEDYIGTLRADAGGFRG